MRMNCNRCGCYVVGQRYDPYNVTFHKFWFTDWIHNCFCLRCAELFVKQGNKTKGGHWVLEKDMKGMISIVDEVLL